MRLGKFYIRSAATGLGKSRSMMADACYLACDEIFNIQLNKWEPTKDLSQGAIFISTELEIYELTTLAIAFISGVNESHILKNKYDNGEFERVKKA